MGNIMIVIVSYEKLKATRASYLRTDWGTLSAYPTGAMSGPRRGGGGSTLAIRRPLGLARPGSANEAASSQSTPPSARREQRGASARGEGRGGGTERRVGGQGRVVRKEVRGRGGRFSNRTPPGPPVTVG